MSYQKCRTSVVMAFGVTRNGEVLLYDHIREEKEALVVCANTLTIKQNCFLEKLMKTSGLLNDTWNEVHSFVYPHLLIGVTIGS